MTARFCQAVHFYLLCLFVKRRVECVEILAVEFILNDSHGVAKSLEMHDLALAEESEGIGDVGIIRETDEVVVGHASLLLRRLRFGKIGKRIALDADVLHIEGHARRRDRIKSRGVIYVVRLKHRSLDLIDRNIPRQLINDRRDHFKVGKLFRAY